jgi:Na+/H+ antiporter NhaD/arsenite permease-like protein
LEPHILSVLPFFLLLISLAILPLTLEKWWSQYYFTVPIAFAVCTTIYYVAAGFAYDLIHSIVDYFKFISLLTALYVVTGGILIELRGYATPFRNIILLFSGAVVSNMIGTTGASMLLIRPYIKTNRIRIGAFHIVFFIFIVSNFGGTLTPIGDPPLFLGYIKGIPFFWLIDKMIIPWLVGLGAVLGIYYVLDMINFKRQSDRLEKMEIRAREKLVFKGWYNLFFVGIIILSVFVTDPPFVREVIMLFCAVLSYKMTNVEIHLKNRFKFHPIQEVALIFLGVFITMTPAVHLLTMHAGQLQIASPSHFYWSTGILSAILDNAPTYITFLSTSMGLYGFDINQVSHVRDFINHDSIYVLAVSMAAVFFGAMTYIGNGPNFMVKSIADHQRVKTPSFGGYILKYSLPVLLPVYALIWWLFIL